jgi:hypothetical protein
MGPAAVANPQGACVHHGPCALTETVIYMNGAIEDGTVQLQKAIRSVH